MTNHGLELLKRNDMWIGNTGATMHSTFCGLYAINKRATTISTTNVSGSSIKPSLQMELECIAMDKNNKEAGPVLLGNVALLESINYNLFSLSKLLNSGQKMHGDASKVVMTNGSKVLTFDIVVKTIKGVLFCAKFKRRGASITGANTELTKLMSINNAHQLLGHANEDTAWAVAFCLGWHIRISKMMPCE